MSILKKIKFKFSNPKKNKIILFDGESSHDLKYVLEGFDYYMLENRSNRIYEIYLSINVIFRFILNYFLLFKKNRNLHTLYLVTIINFINPKVIITSICNSGKFHDLAKLLDKSIFFLAVQNASRSSDYRRDLHRYEKKITKRNINKDYYIPNFYCYGQSEIDDCKKFGVNVINFIKTGSVRIANFFKYVEKNKIKLDKTKYDLCLISENAHDINIKLGETMEEQGFANMAKFVIRYAKESNLKFIFARKRENFTSQANDEMNFFKKYLSTSELNFLKENMNIKKNEYSSYLPLFQSKIAIGTQSTLLKDKISCKEKIFSLNLQKTNIYDFPINGVCSIKNCSYNEFKKKLDQVFLMSNEEYFSNLDKKCDYVIEYNKKENVIDKIRKSIIKNL
tara:strand:+ start:4378 stop:5559 length:1182 start_codon:yes stop_codon:yes gene_type:complete